MSNSRVTKRKSGGDKGRSPTKNVGQQQQAMLAMQQGINMRGSIGSPAMGSKHLNHLGAGRENNIMSAFYMGSSSPSRDEDELDMDEDDGDGEEDDGGDDSAIKGEELNYYRLDVSTYFLCLPAEMFASA
ncbi:hypothetical protein L211DRAFT_853030 [Terfezia boudieri ATCC MYA-4762]|uniref:Uncharacterized protein n=1 Tax=Terfezia boudieri ATCC MYA-4762 TaxID=1051890 RepID=A0A3N4LD71_9PEZI|nr:hypothetical protein L211DRAFT_853030 [Terfezia boudieri ATCC MYA-4762]